MYTHTNMNIYNVPACPIGDVIPPPNQLLYGPRKIPFTYIYLNVLEAYPSNLSTKILLESSQFKFLFAWSDEHDGQLGLPYSCSLGEAEGWTSEKLIKEHCQT